MKDFNNHFHVKAKHVGYYKPALRYIRTGINGQLLDAELTIRIGMQLLKKQFPNKWGEEIKYILKQVKEEI